MKTRILIIAITLGGACATGEAADFPANRSVSDVRLDRIRGGFDLGDNLRASFALQRTVLINGMETMRTTITVPDIANITREQAAALQDALRTTVVTNGAGGMAGTVPASSVQGTSASTPASDGATTTLATVSAALPNSALPGLIVQNSLDNQAITATTTIDASVNSARMLENVRMAESVQDAVIQFRGN
ncbi:hypothetical protein J2T07_002242 [Luteibacter jiangsuensis]|uniref:Uncharacterized protein n=1 Tax=Luteibacter jiangsuensis TaxID=637577 RepID=A0ABT9SYI9_9GAMM|nr:hypothetical protein [Luteibacter jiangsuensis]MDQ0010052.1 hypothetical protein [Luteibacter jiangsuensis]